MNTQQVFQIALLMLVAGIALATTLIHGSIRIAVRLGLVDIPSSLSHKQHARATPQAGGILIIVCLVLLLVLFNRYFSEQAIGILAATMIVFAFGLLDDLRGLGAVQKLFGQLLATLALISFDVSVAIIPGNSIFPYTLNLVITLFWMIGITNAFNLVDGADSLAVCISLIAASFLIVGAAVDLQPQLIFQVSGLLGILIVVLFNNLHPAQMFLGDSGAQSLGFFIAALCIVYTPDNQPQASTWFAPITFVALPIFDVCLVFFSRLRRGKPFYKADLRHTYHRLRMTGYSHLRALGLLGIIGLLVGATGLFSLYQTPLLANLIFLGLVLVGVLIFFRMERILEEANKRF